MNNANHNYNARQKALNAARGADYSIQCFSAMTANENHLGAFLKVLHLSLIHKESDLFSLMRSPATGNLESSLRDSTGSWG